jgi:hypothetical protein
MLNRAWKIRTRAAVALTAGVLALATGGTQAVASPIPAGSSSSPVIEVTQGSFRIVLPSAQAGRFAAADDVTAFHGFSTFRSITIQSQGFDLEGTIKGRLKSHNFVKLYQVYNLPKSSSWGVWVAKFKHDSSQSKLKETFRDEQLIDVDVDIKFKVSASALQNVSTLRIGFETLRLELDGQTKDFTVINGASGSAKDQNGNDVPVDFTPV